MSKPTTRDNYTTVVKNRLQKLPISWDLYKANKLKLRKERKVLEKEIYFLVSRYNVAPAEIARLIHEDRQLITPMLKQKGGVR